MWKRSIPQELRLESFSGRPCDLGQNHILRTFHIQAFTLQLFYDNVQLLLHRPLLAYCGLNLPGQTATTAESSQDDRSEQRRGAEPYMMSKDAEICKLSRDQCWESAIRTSKIGEHQNILLATRNTPAAPFIGIQAFTAGAMLGFFALSTPFTQCAQKSKQAIGRLIQLPKLLNYRTPVSE